MNWFEILSDRAFEFAVAACGGFYAIKDLPPETSKLYVGFILVASVVLGYAFAPAILEVAQHKGWIDEVVAKALQLPIVGLCSALSIRVLDVSTALVLRFKKVKLPGVDDAS